MAGAYCRFCNRRCFVYRQVVAGGVLMWVGHLATCAEGKAHDRTSIGQDADSAYNPLDPDAVSPYPPAASDEPEGEGPSADKPSSN